MVMNYIITLLKFGKVQYKEFNMNFTLLKISLIYMFKFNQNKKQKLEDFKMNYKIIKNFKLKIYYKKIKPLKN